MQKDNNSFVYDDYISKTAIYCNDRSNDNGSFSSDGRLKISSGGIQPTYRCGLKRDGTMSEDADIQDKFTESKILSLKLEYQFFCGVSLEHL